MAKDTKMIAYMRELARLKKQIERDAEEFYSCLVLVMASDKYHWSIDQVEDLLCDVSMVWNESVQHDYNVVDWCKNETGLDIRDTITRPADEDEIEVEE